MHSPGAGTSDGAPQSQPPGSRFRRFWVRTPLAAKVAAAVIATGAAIVLCGAIATMIAVARIESRFPPQGRFLQVAHGRLHFVELRPSEHLDEGTVVLIHGASGSSADLISALGDRLSRRFRVFGIDRPGSGWSDRSAGDDPASPAEQGAVIVDGLRRLGVDRAVFVGHSWSGALVTRIALEHPDLVSGLVLLGPVTHPWPRAELGWYTGPATWPVIGSLLTSTVATPSAFVFVGSMLATIFDPQQPPPGYLERARVPLAFRPATIRANAGDLAGLHRFVTVQSRRYSAIRAPTVIISGEADKVAWTNLHSRSLAREIPGAKLLLLPETGHMPHHAAPDVVSAEVEALAAMSSASAAAR